jgi:hypothetical protein
MVLTVMSCGWAVLILAAPYLATRASPASTSFRGAAIPYLAGRFVCHQRPDRSFHVQGAQLPVCARCSGLYVGAPFGAVLGLRRRLRRAERDVRLRLVLVSTAAPTAVAWALEAAGLVSFGLWERAALALPLGFAICWVAAAALDESPEVN